MCIVKRATDTKNCSTVFKGRLDGNMGHYYLRELYWQLLNLPHLLPAKYIDYKYPRGFCYQQQRFMLDSIYISAWIISQPYEL